MTKKDKEWGRKNRGPHKGERMSQENVESSDRTGEGSRPGMLPSQALDSLAERLRRKRPVNTAPHVIVIARAGTGKTTTLVEGLRVLKTGNRSITPSPQQQAIWDAICLDQPASCSVCFVAFNKSIAEVLKVRVPESCDAMTMHSLGRRAVAARFSRVDLDLNRVQKITAEVLGQDYQELRRRRFELLRATEKLVGLCKLNLVGLDPTGEQKGVLPSALKCEGMYWQSQLAELASHYDVDLNGNEREVFDLVPRVLERCKDVEKDGTVDFNDMIWLPVVLGLHVQKYDLLLVDEAQDLNRCQQQLALKAGRRLILCGDPKQAIYGFAGADGQSMERMQSLLGGNAGSPDEGKYGCIVLPLTVTRRCGRAIVREAQKYVPDFEAHKSCGDGKIDRMVIKGEQVESPGGPKFDYRTVPYTEVVQPGDMILCRCNAPLVSECFRFLREGRKATIQGRDIGQGLISTIRKMKPADDVNNLLIQLGYWLIRETAREQAKPNPSEARLIALQDRHDCIAAFCEDETTVDDVIGKITSVFSDDKGEGIKLSSVHKAKGLEADRVFILQPSTAPMPHPLAKSPWEQEQEMNLIYVAITRAKNELVYVT